MSKSIASRDNASYRQLVQLIESGRERRKSGQTVIEGAHLIRALLERGGRPAVLVVAASRQGEPEIAALLAALPQVPLWVLADPLFRDLGELVSPAGILAIVPIPAPQAPAELAPHCLLIEALQDPGNLGTILRTAAAAGIRQVFLSSQCAAPWSPKVLRAGQGAHFHLDVFPDADLPAIADRFLAETRGQVAATVVRDGQSLYAANLTGPVAWLIGNEGTGVSPELAARADLRVTIPMPGGTESLNAAVAAALCCYEKLRQGMAA